jgi:hypothetical protein
LFSTARQDEKFQEALHAMKTGNGHGSWLDRVMKKRIVVHTRDSMTIAGVLMEQTEDGIILRAAEMLEDGGRKTSLGGETWIPRETVAFAQIDE